MKGQMRPHTRTRNEISGLRAWGLGLELQEQLQERAASDQVTCSSLLQLLTKLARKREAKEVSTKYCENATHACTHLRLASSRAHTYTQH
jgi:hypothetical protein